MQISPPHRSNAVSIDSITQLRWGRHRKKLKNQQFHQVRPKDDLGLDEVLPLTYKPIFQSTIKNEPIGVSLLLTA